MNDYTTLICKDITTFIESSLGTLTCPNLPIDSSLLTAIYQFLPNLACYKEENKEISFKIALGIGLNYNDLNGRFYPLQSYTLSPNSLYPVNDINKIIKDLTIFCSYNANIFIIQNNNKIDFGIFYTDIDKTGQTEDSLLEKKFILFEPVTRTKIVLRSSSREHYIFFDLDNKDNFTPPSIHHSHQSITCSVWDGIFKRVKNEVHGTICLIVDHDWDATNDDNFTDSLTELSNIRLSTDNTNSVDKYIELTNNIEILLSMLDYDGITIIDTYERIRAYHAFCKLNEATSTITGGARHRAYDYLKGLENDMHNHYVALYFQSQEGNIKFYEYKTKTEAPYFNPNIMNGGSDSIYHAELKAYKINLPPSHNLTAFDEYSSWQTLNEKISNLKTAHQGMNNFYNEPLPASELSNLISDSIYTTLIEKYRLIAKELINTVLECFIGNTSGYSHNAQLHLCNIINSLTPLTWDKYLSNNDYITANILWLLSNESLSYRLETLKILLTNRNIDTEKYQLFSRRTSDFTSMYHDFIKL